MSNSETHNQNYFGVSPESLDKLTGRCARSRLDELKNIVNDKYREAIDDAIRSIDANLNYIHIIEVLVNELNTRKVLADKEEL